MVNAWKCYACGRVRRYVANYDPGLCAWCGHGGAVLMNVSRLHLEADEGKREEEERRKLREEIKANDPRLSDADISRADIILAAWDREIPGNGVAQLAAHFAAVREDERRKIGVEFDATLSRLFAKLEEVRRKIDDGVKATQLFPFPFVV